MKNSSIHSEKCFVQDAAKNYNTKKSVIHVRSSVRLRTACMMQFGDFDIKAASMAVGR